MGFDLAGKWRAHSVDYGTVDYDTHVTPIGDLREHEETRLCWCQPFVEDLSRGAMVVHHSLDGRERVEPNMQPKYQERVQ